MKPLCVMLVAAEASSDALGAALARALKARLGDGVGFVGVGGARMAEMGVESPFDLAEISIVGILESVMAYPRVLRCVAATAEVARRERPDIAVLIDSWGFTLRVAKALRRLDPTLTLVKYVGPQVWAWRAGRAKTLAGVVDHLLATQTMDGPYYDAVGLPHTFVGNPAMQADLTHADGARLREHLGIAQDAPVLLVLPGSRRNEITRLMPPFEQAVMRLKAERETLHVIVPAADTVRDQVLARVAGWPFRAHVTQGEAEKFDAMKAATVALAASGTVTTELALAGCPMVVGYKVDPPTAFVARIMVKLRWVTLLNIAAGKEVAPEFIQEDCRPDALAAALRRLLDDPGLRQRQIDAQDEALRLMGRGGPNPAEVSADTILRLLADSRSGAAA
jgi:lipid-A-disaccharide synthase